MLLLLRLKVFECYESEETTDEDDGVQTDARARAVDSGGGRGCCVGFGFGVALLSLQGSDEKALEDFSRFVAVSYIFKGFGCVLAADVEEDFFAAGMLIDETRAIVDFIVDDEEEICLGGVLGDV